MAPPLLQCCRLRHLIDRWEIRCWETWAGRSPRATLGSSALPVSTASIYSPVNGGDCGSPTSRAAGTVAPTLCRQQPGSANIARLHWAKGNLLKIIRPLLPAAVSCRTQPPAPNSAARGSGAHGGPCALRRAGGCGGSRSRISGTCAFRSPVALPLVLRVTHARSGSGLGTSPTGWTDRGCSAPHPRGSRLTSLVPSLANSRRLKDADRADSSSPGKREDRAWRGTCARV